MSRRVLVSLLIGGSISGVGLWSAFHSVDLAAMASGMRRVSAWWVLASVLGGLLTLVVRSFRWRLLLCAVTPVGIWPPVSATFIGTMANNLLPARLGEVARAWVLARREQTPITMVLASILVERLLDVLAALAILGVCLAASPELQGGAAGLLKQTGLAVMGLAVSGVVGLFAAIVFRDRITGAVDTWSRCLRRPWAVSAGEHLSGFLDGLCVLKTGPRTAAVVLLSFLIWGVGIVSFHLLAEGFDLGLTLVQTTLVFVIVLFGVAIPSAPGFIGTFHGFCVAGLAIVAGTDPTSAAAYATLLHGSHWLAINAVGMGFLLADSSVSWTGLAGLTRGNRSQAL